VLPANDHLWMGTGLGGAVKKRGGEEIEIAAVRQGPAPLGRAVATEAGSLPFRRLYHVVLAEQDLKIHQDQIRPALQAALAAASGEGVGRIAIAPLDDEGQIGVFATAAQQVVAALLGALDGKLKIKSVVLVTNGEAGRDAYRVALHAGLRGA